MVSDDDLEIPHSIAVDVAREHAARILQLPGYTRECRASDVGERLVARHRTVGVDRRQVDLVDAALIGVNKVPTARNVEDERVCPAFAYQVIGPEPPKSLSLPLPP